jgi:threonine/homoserine/homoserine lactone efflux protein
VDEFVAFLTVAALVIATPGPDTVVTIRSALVGGRRAGVSTVCGVLSGQICWTVAASLGVTALLAASETAYLIVRLLGAAYLAYQGGCALRSAITRRPQETHMEQQDALSSVAAYRHGLISNLGNPKMLAFFTSLLPQLGASNAAPSLAQMVTFGLLFSFLTGLWLMMYAVAAHRLATLSQASVVRRGIEATTGAVLMAFGVRLALEASHT